MIKRLYIIFGRSQHKLFVIMAKKYYFDKLFLKYEVKDINDLLRKLIHKKNPQFYHEHIKFRKSKNAQLIEFTGLKRKQTIIVKYISLYNDYIWICTGKSQYETFGYEYWNFHDKHIDEIFKYSTLKKKRVHNLKYYDLFHKADNIYDSTYKLKPDALIYKVGTTVDLLDFYCIKL